MSVFYNPKKIEQEKLKEEKEKKKAKKDETEKRTAWFARMGKDKNFQKYIMQDIIDKEIQSNSVIDQALATLIIADSEKGKNMMLAKSGGKIAAQNIKNKILKQIR